MITEEDEKFALALVALARAHDVHFIKYEYRHSHKFSSIINGTWSSGRHGITAHITIRAEEVKNLQEAPVNKE